MARSKTGKASDYYPGGKKRPVLHGATPEMARHKLALVGESRRKDEDAVKRFSEIGHQPELTVVGLLAARGLITASQREAADEFAALHNFVWDHLGTTLQAIGCSGPEWGNGQRPRSAQGMLSRVKSPPGPDDLPRAGNLSSVGDDLMGRVEAARMRYNRIEEKLPASQWRILCWLALYSETSGWHSYGWLEQQIRTQDLRWDSALMRVTARRKEACILADTRATILLIRTTLQAVAGLPAEDLRPVAAESAGERIPLSKRRRSSLERDAARVPRRREDNATSRERRHEGASYAMFNEMNSGL